MGSAVRKWLAVLAGFALVVLGLFLVKPDLIEGVWDWIRDNPRVMTMLAGIAILVIGVMLIRGGLRKGS